MSRDILAQPPQEDDGSAAILAIVNPPVGCIPCYAERGEPFPPTHSTRTCERHAATLRRPQAPAADAITGWVIDALLTVCADGQEVLFRLAQLRLARSETVAYSKGL